ncbi:MAG: C39 family peptidase [Synechococcaceae cyanobacterium]|nr:C39 family peptidase [Synechococcaceae cyanobacterium]
MSKRISLLVSTLILGLVLPAAAQEQLNGSDSICKSMGPSLVLTITAVILTTIILVLILIATRLQKGGWSLANAVSEPTHLSIPLDEHWAQSQGDSKSQSEVLSRTGPPRPVILMEASSSRLIALAGTVAILMIYIGFGTFSLYTYGLTCQMPASTVAVSTFLYSGLTLFAPYIANKFSGRLPAVKPTPPLNTEAPAHPIPLLQTAMRGAGSGPAHRLSGAAATRPLLARATAAVGQTAVASAPTTTATTTPTSAAAAATSPPYATAVQLIAEFEGFVDHAYPDPASGGEPWTIGYGFTRLDGRPVQPGDTISKAEADAQLLSGVQSCARQLGSSIPYWNAMAEDQRCALLSFAWNLGEGFYGGDGFDTISRCLREKDWQGVPAALLLYCDPGTAVSAGLLRRRQAEAALWKQGLASLTTPTPAGGASQATGMNTVPAKAPEPAHPNPLNVPWFDQLAMNDGQGWRDCFSASSAMIAAYWGKEPNEDDYNTLRQSYGDSTSAEAQLAALRHLGLQAEFRTDGSLQTLKDEINAGRPVAVGWLHHGPPTAPSGGGHWTVVIGYDDSGVIMNDPYGSCDLVNGGYPENHNGSHQHYSYANWEPRWRPQGSGGWYLVAQR